MQMYIVSLDSLRVLNMQYVFSKPCWLNFIVSLELEKCQEVLLKSTGHHSVIFKVFYNFCYLRNYMWAFFGAASFIIYIIIKVDASLSAVWEDCKQKST